MHCGTWNHFGRGCHTGPAPGPAHHHAAACGCGCDTHTWRRFPTEAETVGRLERYLQDLKKEAQAVEERIAALQAK